MARKVILLALALSLGSYLAIAQTKDYSRIARLSYLEGKVSFQHTDEVEWTAANINMALQPGDRIYAGGNGRAEIEFDDGSVLRLAEKTDIEILAMRDERIQVRVLVGLCSLTGRSDVEFEIDTPAAAFTTTEKGSYRFDVAENGDSDGIVRKGAMDAVNNRLSKRVSSGEVLHVPASELVAESLARYDQRDAWDEWTDRRNAEENAVESRRYIADSVNYGVSDLDRYGRWVSVDAYGPAWVPMVGSSWSPYWDGRWWYRPNWGWTWVSYEPWGWLPYHYGRWYNSASFGWCWIPGPSFGFHFWSPGLVRFYRGVDLDTWVPLGPGDYYNINNYHFNISNRANLYYLNEMRLMQRRGPDDLINRHAQGAFRSVNTDQFVNGNFGGRTQIGRGITDPRQAGRIVTDQLDVRPSSRSFAPGPERAIDRPSINSRPVVVRTEPDARSRNDRFIAITNPAIIAQPRSRAEQAQPSRDMRNSTSPNQSRTQVVPGNGGASRTMQAPDSRSTPTQRSSTTARPTTNNRETQVLPGQRQDATRSGQSNTTSRMDPTPPPAARPSSGNSGYSGSSNTGRTYMGGYSTGGSSMGSSSVSSPQSSTTSSAPVTSAPPSSGSSGSGGGAVKKMPERPMTSSYAPRSYQPPRGEYSTARPVSSAPQSYARSYSAPAVESRTSYPAARSYAGVAPQRSSPGEMSRISTMNSAPRMVAQQSSAPRSSAASAGPSRSSAPQRSAGPSGSSSSGRRR